MCLATLSFVTTEKSRQLELHFSSRKRRGRNSKKGSHFALVRRLRVVFPLFPSALPSETRNNPWPALALTYGEYEQQHRHFRGCRRVVDPQLCVAHVLKEAPSFSAWTETNITLVILFHSSARDTQRKRDKSGDNIFSSSRPESSVIDDSDVAPACLLGRGPSMMAGPVGPTHYFPHQNLGILLH